jgi:hypothetical protein
VAKLLERTVEYEDEFEGTYVFGYFDGIPTQREAAEAYFSYRKDGLPEDWETRPDVARVGDPPPERVCGRWRVLLGEDC